MNKKLSILLEILELLFLPLICLPIHFKLLEKKELDWWKWKPIMWCGYILCQPGFNIILKDKREWIHQNIHLQQARSHFVTWPGYYLSYFLDNFLGFICTGSWRGGKLTGKWESEAYGEEDNQDYVYNYHRDLIRKYTFTLSERHELWKNVEEDYERWIKLLKEL